MLNVNSDIGLSKTPISLVHAGMGVTSMMGLAANEVGVAMTVRTMPVSAAPCLAFAVGLPMVRAGAERNVGLNI